MLWSISYLTQRLEAVCEPMRTAVTEVPTRASSINFWTAEGPVVLADSQIEASIH